MRIFNNDSEDKIEVHVSFDLLSKRVVYGYTKNISVFSAVILFVEIRPCEEYVLL